MTARGRKPGSLARFSCRRCRRVELVRGGTAGFHCAECRATGLAPSLKSRSDWLGKDVAQRMVSISIRGGLLPKPRLLACVDCGGAASEYEHRDYNEPLRVEPICRRCNLRRGPAIPKHGSVDQLLAHGLVPYRSMRATRMLFASLGRPDVAELVRRKPTIDDWRRLWPLIAAADAPAPQPAVQVVRDAA